MKRIYYVLCIALLFTACKKEDQSAKLLDQYQALNERTEAEYKQLEDPAQADSLIAAFTEEAFALQQAAPESEAAYVILQDLYYVLSTEQKEQAFAVLNLDSLEAHGLQRHYDCFLAEQKTAVGMQFTDFNALNKDGEQIALSTFVGQSDYLLVDFWASWCRPCRESMPGLKELLAQHSDKLAIVGISRDDNADEWLQAIDALELTWSHLRDASGDGAKTYGILFIPSTILISRDGTIISRNPSHEQLHALLHQ